MSAPALRPSRVLVACVAIGALACTTAPVAWAGDGTSSFVSGLSNVAWAEHPGAAIAAVACIVLASLASAAGLGCAIALFGVVVPRVRDAVEAAARAASAGRVLLVGSLTLGGVLFALMGAQRTGVPAVAVTAFVLLGLPTLALFVVGALGAVPLLGERLLGTRGGDASPIRRCVTATVVIGAAFLPAVAFQFWLFGVLVGLVALAWPLGVGIQASRRIPGLSRGTGGTGGTEQ